MKRYAIGISDTFSNNNEIKVIESNDEISAVFGAACCKRKEIRHLKEKLLNDYKTVEKLKTYFLEYWGLSITSPYGMV